MLVRVTGWAGVLLATAVAAYAGERAPAHGRSGRAIRRPPGATRDDQFCEGLRPMTLNTTVSEGFISGVGATG